MIGRLQNNDKSMSWEHVPVARVGIDTRPDHPIIRLQRARERSGIGDTHLGLHHTDLKRLIALLESAAAEQLVYTSYLAGEILASLTSTNLSRDTQQSLRARVLTVVDR